MNHVSTLPVDVSRSEVQLAEIVERVAAQPEAWLHRVRLRADRRWYERLYVDADHDVWLISWLPGQGTGFHDHGPSSGAFAVASGVLEEERADGTALIHPGGVRTFGPSFAHDVRNPASGPAISIHAYSPPLTTMTHYEREGDELVPVTIPREPDDDDRDDRGGTPPAAGGPSGVERLLAAARARLHRLSAVEAMAAIGNDAILVDIRPAAQRAAEGEIPGALVVERNVLEWRFDPASDARLTVATGYDVQVIVFCSEGYTSSLAAAALQEIGLWRATDVVGGFHAWKAAGLPTASAPRP
jgi:rhodanese-related sulfurtransferase/mannose-6-phosphate isomerase-like protein (cupin superfamily)